MISVEGVETLVAPSEYCWFSITTNNKRIREIDAEVVNDGPLDYMSTKMPLGLREGELVPAKRVRKRLQRYTPVECVCMESEEDCSEEESDCQESEDEEYCPEGEEESEESEESEEYEEACEESEYEESEYVDSD